MLELEKSPLIAYLGPAGTFTHTAALRIQEQFPALAAATLSPCGDIGDVLYALEEGRVALGVVPVENSIEGSVNTSIDMLVNEVNLWVAHEVILTIRHNLVASEMLTARPERVYSHPQALAQCRLYLREHYPAIEKITTNSTIQSLEKIGEDPARNVAIAPLEVVPGDGYRLLGTNIGDYAANQTRFYLVAKVGGDEDVRRLEELLHAGPSPAAGPSRKSTVAFELQVDRPGGLLEVLELYKARGLNLTKIESRPAKHKLGSYVFIIDCEGDLRLPENQSILEGIAARSIRWKLLGVYSHS